MHNKLNGQSSFSSSPARLAANQANAGKSTGPVTDAGRAASRLNAVKTGLTGRTVLLSSDDADQYKQHIAQWEAELQPVGPRECSLVQSIADAYWRTDRITRLEFTLWAQGHTLFADQFASEHHTPELRRGLIEMETALHFEKQFRNLHLQESRIRRAREKDVVELKALQAKRHAEAAEKAQRAALAIRKQQAAGAASNANGFVFAKQSAVLTSPVNTASSNTANYPVDEAHSQEAAA